MFAVLYFYGGIGKNVPYPRAFEVLTNSFPRVHAFVLDIKLRLDTENTSLGGGLPTEELYKNGHFE
jgi:hypothetical protein